jgi:hypothetical protein
MWSSESRLLELKYRSASFLADKFGDYNCHSRMNQYIGNCWQHAAAQILMCGFKDYHADNKSDVDILKMDVLLITGSCLNVKIAFGFNDTREKRKEFASEDAHGGDPFGFLKFMLERWKVNGNGKLRVFQMQQYSENVHEISEETGHTISEEIQSHIASGKLATTEENKQRHYDATIEAFNKFRRRVDTMIFPSDEFIIVDYHPKKNVDLLKRLKIMCKRLGEKLRGVLLSGPSLGNISGHVIPVVYTGVEHYMFDTHGIEQPAKVRSIQDISPFSNVPQVTLASFVIYNTGNNLIEDIFDLPKMPTIRQSKDIVFGDITDLGTRHLYRFASELISKYYITNKIATFMPYFEKSNSGIPNFSVDGEEVVKLFSNDVLKSTEKIDSTMRWETETILEEPAKLTFIIDKKLERDIRVSKNFPSFRCRHNLNELFKIVFMTFGMSIDTFSKNVMENYTWGYSADIKSESINLIPNNIKKEGIHVHYDEGKSSSDDKTFPEEVQLQQKDGYDCLVGLINQQIYKQYFRNKDESGERMPTFFNYRGKRVRCEPKSKLPPLPDKAAKKIINLFISNYAKMVGGDIRDGKIIIPLEHITLTSHSQAYRTIPREIIFS